jgi:hypothetical protein
MKDVQFNLTLEEANLILNALGNLPFHQVSGLIAKLHTQANKQLQATQENVNAQLVGELHENGRK